MIRINKQKLSAFTLIELLIVVTLVVILGLAMLVGINPLVQILKGYDSVRKADLKKIQTALEAYYEDHGCYPPFISLDATTNNTTNQAITYYVLSHCDSTEFQPYLQKIPCDPNTHQPYSFTLPINASGNVSYALPDKKCPQGFVVYTRLANQFENTNLNVRRCILPTNKGTVAVYGESLIPGQVSNLVCSAGLCSKYYALVDGNCQMVSEYEVPPNNPNFCELSSCNKYFGLQ